MTGARIEVLNLPIASARCTSCTADYLQRDASADIAVRVGNAKLRLCVKCAVELWKALVPHIFKNVEIEGDGRPPEELFASLVEGVE